MTVNHTPGPWKAEKENAHTGQVATCHGDGDGWWEIWSPNWGDGINAEANARLIAAAPELLEVLECILDISEDIIPLGSCGEKARAAIAKAKGEAP
jgi:hypothetical protein